MAMEYNKDSIGYLDKNRNIDLKLKIPKSPYDNNTNNNFPLFSDESNLSSNQGSIPPATSLSVEKVKSLENVGWIIGSDPSSPVTEIEFKLRNTPSQLHSNFEYRTATLNSVSTGVDGKNTFDHQYINNMKTDSFPKSVERNAESDSFHQNARQVNTLTRCATDTALFYGDTTNNNASLKTFTGSMEAISQMETSKSKPFLQRQVSEGYLPGRQTHEATNPFPLNHTIAVSSPDVRFVDNSYSDKENYFGSTQLRQQNRRSNVDQPRNSDNGSSLSNSRQQQHEHEDYDNVCQEAENVYDNSKKSTKIISPSRRILISRKKLSALKKTDNQKENVPKYSNEDKSKNTVPSTSMPNCLSSRSQTPGIFSYQISTSQEVVDQFHQTLQRSQTPAPSSGKHMYKLSEHPSTSTPDFRQFLSEMEDYANLPEKTPDHSAKVDTSRSMTPGPFLGQELKDQNSQGHPFLLYRSQTPSFTSSSNPYQTVSNHCQSTKNHVKSTRPMDQTNVPDKSQAISSTEKSNVYQTVSHKSSVKAVKKQPKKVLVSNHHRLQHSSSVSSINEMSKSFKEHSNIYQTITPKASVTAVVQRAPTNSAQELHHSASVSSIDQRSNSVTPSFDDGSNIYQTIAPNESKKGTKKVLVSKPNRLTHSASVSSADEMSRSQTPWPSTGATMYRIDPSSRVKFNKTLSDKEQKKSSNSNASTRNSHVASFVNPKRLVSRSVSTPQFGGSAVNIANQMSGRNTPGVELPKWTSAGYVRSASRNGGSCIDLRENEKEEFENSKPENGGLRRSPSEPHLRK